MSGAGTWRNPFPGLRPFREDEEPLFFGREAHVDSMVDSLGAQGFLAVVGSSGSGKSSLVSCGLIPALHRGLLARTGSGWRVATCRPGNQPMAALAEALAQPAVLPQPAEDETGFRPAELVAATLAMGKRGLLEAYREAQPLLDGRPNLLVVVDQFEELFRYRMLGGGGADTSAASETATAFVNLLLEVANQPRDAALPVFVVITMRSDFLGECAQFDGLPEAINRGQYLVPRMTREQRRAAIAGPVGVCGASIDPVLLTPPGQRGGRQPRPAVDPAACAEPHLGPLARCRQPGPAAGRALRRRRRHGRRAGPACRRGPGRAAAGPPAGAVRRAVPRHHRPRQRCPRHPPPDPAGHAVRHHRCPRRRAGGSDGALPRPRACLPDATAWRAAAAATVVDISHESLMRVWGALRGWVDEEAESARIYRRLAETAELHRDNQAVLLVQPELQLVTAWAARQQPNAAWAARIRAGFDVAMQFCSRARPRLPRRWPPSRPASWPRAKPRPNASARPCKPRPRRSSTSC